MKLGLTAKKVFLFLISLFCFLYKTSAQVKITLHQAIELTMKNNIQLKQANINMDLSFQDLKKSKYDLLPTMSVSMAPNVNFGRSLDPVTYNFVTEKTISFSAAASSDVTIFQGFQKLNLIRENKLI